MKGLLFASLALSLQHVRAHPASTHSQSLAKRTVDLDSFRLKVAAEYVNSTAVDTGVVPTIERRGSSPEDTAIKLVKRIAKGAEFRLVESYTGDNGVTHFYFKQTANGVDIDNGDFNVNIDRKGKVFSYGNSFYSGKIPAKSDLKKRAQVDPADALKGAISALQLPVTAGKAISQQKEGKETFAIKNTKGAVSEPEARLVYIQTGDGNLELTWRVETDILSNWLLTYVDAKTGEQVHGVVDYSADATYQVYPWGINDPTEGNRVVLQDPWNKQTSEFGWHSTGSESFKSTRGNNGIAQTNHENTADYINKPRPSDPSLDFQYPYSLQESDWESYANASVTQLFYTANTYHDLLHTLGFNEKAGNFEVNNNGAGGVGNDFAILNAQDGSGLNNANFATPPDGQPGRMRMYMWNGTNPWRDCSFEAGVVIHEYTHGVSNRLTGGPANTKCLNILEAGGMGEGWSDFMATAIRLKKGDNRETDYPMGAWVSGKPGGIRTYVYSTDMAVNPHVYTDVNALTKVHQIGTVWATMLYEVLWNLIDKHGKNDAPVPSFNKGVPTDGRYLAMKLVIDGMALQPCNPTFVSARNAIIDADKALTGGENVCEIWTAFAKRGLGDKASYSSTSRKADFSVPKNVCKGRH